MGNLRDASIARVYLEGDQQRALGYLPQAKHLLRQTLDRARVGGLSQLSSQMRLADDAYCYVTCAGGINQITVVAGPPTTQKLPETVVAVPDFVSGTVAGGDIVTQNGVQVLENLTPTGGTVARMKLKNGAAQPSYKLAVAPPAALGGSGPSQAVAIKPTLYSGRMRELVQVLQGFGRQRKRANQLVSAFSRSFDADQDEQVKLSTFEKTSQKDGLQIQYDWRFQRTHGLCKGADGKFWIIEIGISRGVVAWPLELNDGSTKDWFRALCETRKDSEALWILDQYGGFPTGAPLPTGDDAKTWTRAGKLVQLASIDDMNPFYQKTMYSDDVGWAFNWSGTEAHNTAWYMDGDIPRGVHYMLPIAIGALKTPLDATKTAALRTALGGLPPSTKVAAAVWKLDYLSAAQLGIANNMLSSGAAAALNYVDGLEVQALKSFSAPLRIVSDGPLVCDNRILTPPCFWLSSQGGKARASFLISSPVDMSEDALKQNPEGVPYGLTMHCDTTVFVFFMKDELHWVRYYNEEKSDASDTSSSNANWPPVVDPDGLHIALQSGSATNNLQVENAATSGRYADFYSNTVDPRALRAAPGRAWQTETFASTKIGEGGNAASVGEGDDPSGPGGVAAKRVLVFLITDEVTTQSPAVVADQDWVMSSAVMPRGDREAVYVITYAAAWVSQSTTNPFPWDNDSGAGYVNGYAYDTYFGETGSGSVPDPPPLPRTAPYPDGFFLPLSRTFSVDRSARFDAWLTASVLRGTILAAAAQDTVYPEPPSNPSGAKTLFGSWNSVAVDPMIEVTGNCAGDAASARYTAQAGGVLNVFGDLSVAGTGAIGYVGVLNV